MAWLTWTGLGYAKVTGEPCSRPGPIVPGKIFADGLGFEAMLWLSVHTSPCRVGIVAVVLERFGYAAILSLFWRFCWFRFLVRMISPIFCMFRATMANAT